MTRFIAWNALRAFVLANLATMVLLWILAEVLIPIEEGRVLLRLYILGASTGVGVFATLWRLCLDETPDNEPPRSYSGFSHMTICVMCATLAVLLLVNYLNDWDRLRKIWMMAVPNDVDPVTHAMFFKGWPFSPGFFRLLGDPGLVRPHELAWYGEYCQTAWLLNAYVWLVIVLSVGFIFQWLTRTRYLT